MPLFASQIFRSRRIDDAVAVEIAGPMAPQPTNDPTADTLFELKNTGQHGVAGKPSDANSGIDTSLNNGAVVKSGFGKERIGKIDAAHAVRSPR